MNYKRIHEISAKKGISLLSLAEKVNLSRAGLYKAMKNESLKVADLERIAKELNVPLYEFFDDEISYKIVDNSKSVVSRGQVLLSDILQKYEGLQGKFLDMMMAIPETQVKALFKEKSFVEFRDQLSNLINKEEIESLQTDAQKIITPEK